jgi:hypothetical protein
VTTGRSSVHDFVRVRGRMPQPEPKQQCAIVEPAAPSPAPPRRRFHLDG